MTAFVLGNGRSRSGIDINQLSQIGPIYGCNALYRSHSPSVLVATDKAISEEIQRSGYSLKNRFYTRRPMPGLGALPVPEKYYGYSSGPLAAALAAQDKHAEIFLLGFDMGPSESGRFNNIYADSPYYRKSSDPPTYTGNWARQLHHICLDYPTARFVRIHGITTAEIKEFGKLSNMSKMDIAAFLDRINKPKDL